MLKTMPHLVRVYLDPFSLAMLQQLLHFCRHSEEENTTSLTTWGRTALLPGAQIHEHHRHIFQSMAPARELFEQLMALKAEHGRIEIEVHANQAHSPETLAPFINILHFLRYPVRQIHLYEDGTQEYAALLLLNEYVDLMPMLAAQQARLEDYLYLTPRTTPLPSGLTGTAWAQRALLGMCWHRLYPTRYHMVRPEILTKLPGLQALADELDPHLERTDWSVFRTLSARQQGWVFQALGLDRVEIERTFAESPNPLIVTGTAIGSNGAGLVEQSLLRMHRDVFKQMRKVGNPCSVPGGHSLLYKGHPGAPRMNSALLSQNRKLKPLPLKLPLEVLLMLGLPLNGFCGFVSTANLSLSKEQIRFVMIPPYTRVSREKTLRTPPPLASITNSFELSQYTLPRLLLLLDIVDERQLVFYHELFKRGEIPFPAWCEFDTTSIMASRAIDDIKSGRSFVPPPLKMLTLGFYIGHPQHYLALEKSLDSLLRMGSRCVLVIDEAAEDFAAVCELMTTVTRKDLEAFTLSAVQEAGVRFDSFVTPPGRDELQTYGYHPAEYGESGALGTQSTLLQRIANIQRKFSIITL